MVRQRRISHSDFAFSFWATHVEVFNNGRTTNVATIDLRPADPALFTVRGTGYGQLDFHPGRSSSADKPGIIQINVRIPAGLPARQVQVITTPYQQEAMLVIR